MTSQLVLVTGGAGHVGSHVIEQLLQVPGNRVISLDNYFNGSEANHIPGAEYRRGHTRDITSLVPPISLDGESGTGCCVDQFDLLLPAVFRDSQSTHHVQIIDQSDVVE